MGKTVHNEHFVPDPGKTILDYFRDGERTPVHHLIRYEWAETVLAAENARGRVLDVACGAGYGSDGMARKLPDLTIVGGDYDRDAIEFATEHYQAPNLSFVVADVTRWEESIGSEPFDWIVSFDTIEHLEHREIMMQNIVEHLTPNGTLLLSTPVRGQTRLNPGWEHHKIEFGRAALYDFLRRYFEEVRAPDFGTLPCVEVFDQINITDPPFYLLKMNPVLCRRPIVVRMPPKVQPAEAQRPGAASAEKVR